MNELRIVVPTRLVKKLEARNVSQGMIHKAVAKTIIDTLEELAKPRTASESQPPESKKEDYRHIILELRGGSPPSLDEPFRNGLTLGQWLALGDAEQEALWEKWEEKEWKKLEKKYGDGLDVKLKPRPAGQERGTQLSRRAGETRAKYTIRKKRTSRVRPAKR